VSGLLSKIIDKINFQTETQVESVSSTTDSEGFYTLATRTRGSVRAKKVIFATNAYTAALLPELYVDKIVPIRGTASRVVRRDESSGGGASGQFRELQQRVNTYNLAYGGTMQDYLIHRPDGGVIFGGGYSVFNGREELFRGTVDDSEVIMEKEMTAYFERIMTETYRDWALSGAKVDRIWTGSESIHPFPFVHVRAHLASYLVCHFRSQITWLTEPIRNQQSWVQPPMDTHILALSLAGRINSSVPALTARGCRISSSPQRVWPGWSMKVSSSRILRSLEFSKPRWIGCSRPTLSVRRRGRSNIV
jgi:hypothetical protein